MAAIARRIVLPNFTLTQTTQDARLAASTILLPDGTTYYTRRKIGEDGHRIDGQARWAVGEFDRYPIILRATGEPWDEANVWIMSKLEETLYPDMETFLGIAEDLAAFCKYLDEKNLDWLEFPEFRLHRPTYRYSKYLRDRVDLGEVKASTAKRRMSRVVNFYRDLINHGLIKLANAPWKKGEAYIHISGRVREGIVVKVETIDVGIRIPETEDPFDETIADGGRLRPLPPHEQAWLLEALVASDHPEHTLTHLLSLATGARIQTALTIRIKHVMQPYNGAKLVRLPVGPGTGVDTKRGKKYTLRIPGWLYVLLQTYAISIRARKRRAKTILGDHPDQYLFLAPTGSPLYTHRDDHHFENGTRRHSKRGQTIRTYMQKYIIPYIRKHYSPTFTYQFHDLRATFGMNLVDACTPQILKGIYTYGQVLAMVANRMGHSNTETTERYLKYRERIALAQAAQDGWEDRLAKVAQKFMTKMSQ